MSDLTAQRWGADLADTLADGAARVARLAVRIGADWPDAQGQAWVDRLGALSGELDRAAATAGELNRPGPADPGVAGAAGTGLTAGRAGVQLGGTGGHRSDDDRGIRIAQLPEPGPELQR